ncbi:MAG: ABC transporter permease [Verrucomicrobia bacterium]|nr:ABC transporter permease [Verrucomicrobiota bacterium]
MTSTAAQSAPRVAANLSHAFAGVWQLTLRRYLLPSRWITVGIGIVVLALLSLGSGHPFDEPGRYTGWAIQFYITFLVPAIAFMAAGGALRDEMKSGTVDYVLTRPLPRPAFVGFKFLSHLVCAQLDLLLAFAVVVGVGLFRHAPGLALAALPMLVAQGLLVTAFSALGFLCGAITTRYVFIGLGYAAIIEAGVGQIPTQLSRLSMTHQVRDLLAPHFERAAEQVTLLGWVGTGAIVAVFTVLFLGAAAAVFTVRELAGPADA